MPYIKQEDRRRLESAVAGVEGQIAERCSAGDLNYIITRVVRMYIAAQGKNYAAINAGVGALECAKLELYRRLAAPYEDTKIVENGDVG